MTATDELRRILTEKGVEWQAYELNPFEKVTSWDMDTSDPAHEVCAALDEFDSGTTLLRFWNCTPEQAVDATLGRDNSVVVHRLEQLRGGHFSWPRLYEAVTGEIHSYEMPASEAEALFIDCLIRLVCGAKGMSA